MDKEYRSVKRNGVEILRICVSLPELSDVGQEIADFYRLLSERVKNGAEKSLTDIAEKDFYEVKKKRSFFKRYNYFFECERENKKGGAFMNLNIRLTKGREQIFSRKISHFLKIDEGIIIKSKPKENIVLDNAENP
ncbi:MAG: hypothetical protein IJ303_05860 [Clostridia bacterium]|nr:hypothetical protein [Clostridia bacterium]